MPAHIHTHCAINPRSMVSQRLNRIRADPAIHWLPNFGSDEDTIRQARDLVAHHVEPR